MIELDDLPRVDGVVDVRDQRDGARRAVCDVAIIGSGCAGATAARVLSAAGLDVALLEEGPYVPTERFVRDTWGAFKQLWRDQGFQVARGRTFLPILQGRAVGGSTPINGAIVHRIPEPILESWADRGAAELLDAAELERVYGCLDRELGVAPAPAEVLGRNNTLMADGLRGVGASGHPIRRNVRGCEGSALCMSGCAGARKQSMLVTYVPRALEAGARVFATCRAERIEVRGGRGRAVVARFRDHTGVGGWLHLEARHAILVGASAVQTPLLLRASGIGRASGLVGERFQCHPGSSVLGVFDEPVKLWFGATQGYETTHWWDERMKMETVGMSLDVAAGRLPGFGPALMRRLREFAHVAQWGVQVRSEAHGRVRRGPFGKTDIRFDLTDADVRVLKTGLVRLTEMMFAAGARKVYPGVFGIPEEIDSVDPMRRLHDLPDDPRLFHGIASHMFGTAVMGSDARTSVVGPDLQAHDARGVYVIDSSAFPTNMGVNPAHTIAAVAWRVAERLADRLA